MDQQLMSNAPAVVMSELPSASGLLIGHAMLNVEATLNSLSLDMIRLLHPALEDWSGRDDIAGVIITAAGDKAFCAGGDIQALYHSISANHAAGEVVEDYPFRFFEEEYRLDYCIHTYPKPLVSLGHGIVMGGGLGVLGGSQFRVLTEKSRLAMPEITIGLFPDAGASWTLKNMQQHHAEFLGLTGSHVNAADALVTGMGTHVIEHDRRGALLDGLPALPWTGNSGTDAQMLGAWLEQLDTPPLPDSEMRHVPERSINHADLAGEVAAITDLAGRSKWIDRGIANMTGGCPCSAGIVLEQLARVAHMSLADAFRMELTVATHCANNSDFAEGVRALLIDKDGAAQWRFGSVEALPREYVLSHFEPPWATHPLADLGR